MSLNVPSEILHGTYRVPVMIRPEDEAFWLETEVTDPELLQPLLVPSAAVQMEAYVVSTAVNRPANDGVQAARPAAEVLIG